MCIFIFVCVHLLSCVQFFAAPWSVAHQAPLFMEFPRQGYWSGLPFPTPGELPDPGIEPESPVSPALAGGFLTASTTLEAPHLYLIYARYITYVMYNTCMHMSE